jgi:hypothetical protein
MIKGVCESCGAKEKLLFNSFYCDCNNTRFMVNNKISSGFARLIFSCTGGSIN